MNTLLGEKLGMTQVFADDASAVPVTIVKAGPCRVVQIKRPDTDGYSAIQLSFRELDPNKVNKPTAGHYARAGVPPARHLVEVQVDNPDDYELGQEFTVADVFAKGMKADVAGVTKGKGFSGVIKRHNFAGQGASHGAHRVHRAPGSIGACATPSRVFRGMPMAGRMGTEKRTVLNIDVVDVDAAQGLLLLKGAVPGGRGSVILIREAVKVGG